MNGEICTEESVRIGEWNVPGAQLCSVPPTGRYIPGQEVPVSAWYADGSVRRSVQGILQGTTPSEISERALH